ncbi:hypothetical protein SH449x_002567 [Pirellulaceae bacterium SH449]
MAAHDLTEVDIFEFMMSQVMFLKGTMMSIESFGKVAASIALVAGLALAFPQVTQAQSRINDKVSRNNGAGFWANQRTSRNIQHARDYSTGIQRYATHSPMIQTQVTQGESQMLGQQLQAIQRDLVIVREEHGANPKVLQHVKKMETQLGQATTIQKSLHEECCKQSPDGKVCAEMCSKMHASLEELKKEHDQVLKELGHEEAAYASMADAHQHHSSPAANADK